MKKVNLLFNFKNDYTLKLKRNLNYRLHFILN